MTLTWLSRLCDPRSSTPLTHHPVTVELDGAPWVVATDGCALVALRENAPSGFPPAPATHLPTLTRLLSTPRAETPVDLAALRAWAEPPQWPGHAPCPRCQGAGHVDCPQCRGEGRSLCVCAACQHEHEGDCQTCAGDGQIPCWPCESTGREGGRLPVRPGRIGPLTLNRELLARALAELPGDTVTLAAPGPDDPLRVDGPGWRVLIMPLRGPFPPETPEWPLTP